MTASKYSVAFNHNTPVAAPLLAYFSLTFTFLIILAPNWQSVLLTLVMAGASAYFGWHFLQKAMPHAGLIQLTGCEVSILAFSHNSQTTEVENTTKKAHLFMAGRVHPASVILGQVVFLHLATKKGRKLCIVRLTCCDKAQAHLRRLIHSKQWLASKSLD